MDSRLNSSGSNDPKIAELQELLEQKFNQYHNRDFILNDPISVPHQYEKKEDIEISGFLAATIAWGQRVTIIKNANRLMHLMDNNPYEFIMYAKDIELLNFEKFVHRTFNPVDCLYFIESLRNIYQNHGGLQTVFEKGYNTDNSIKSSISGFRNVFFELPHLKRTGKHIANVNANASAKRINMYLRWMVRNDHRLVDFGIWDGIPPSALHIPLDVHSGNVARKLGLLVRKQDDWKAVEELTSVLRIFDPLDPVKYDYALFGMGIYGDL
jgi:uncharacterized protein (TIGR02757 family)